MLKILRITWLNIKSILCSKEVLMGIALSFAYSMLWILAIHPKHMPLEGYDAEFGRFLYMVILYVGISILRNDIRSNTIKCVLTGTLSRRKIMLAKQLALLACGFFFFLLMELNSILAAVILHNKIAGIGSYLSFNHVELLIAYITITLGMGNLMILIVAVIFNDKKSILGWIVFLAMVNFYNFGLVTFLGNNSRLAGKFGLYLKTSIYSTSELMMGIVNSKTVSINVVSALVLFVISTLVIAKREIK